MKPQIMISSLAVILGLSAGCSTPEPPKTPAESSQADADRTGAAGASRTGETGDQQTFPGKDPNKGNVVIGEKIRALCKEIPTAYFPFDSAALSPEAKTALSALAKCFVSGPAKGKGIRLVGHADPRGETDYNFGLGQQRAGSVGKVLVGFGLAEGKIASSSRGELDATGTDETSWAKDRKVEIFLADDDDSE